MQLEKWPWRKALWSVGAAVMMSESLAVEYQVSGYSRVVAGLLDDSDVSYLGYSDKLAADNNSLLGLQGRVDFNCQWSVTALAQLQANKRETSGLEWLYLSWKPVESFTLKLGKMQTPFFSLSDVLEVGFAYPWVMAPREVYSDFLFKSYQGVDLRYSQRLGEATLHLEGYYGRYDDDIYINHAKVRADVNDLAGLITELSWQEWRFRASYHSAEFGVDLPELVTFSQLLAAAGFVQSANSLATKDDAQFFQFSADYDSLVYFLKAEYALTQTESDLYPDIEAFYVSAGYYFDKFTTYLTYSRRRDSLVSPVETIPVGIDPMLDQLSFTYSQILASRAEDDIDSYAVGGRWDFSADMALKVELKRIDAQIAKGSTFRINDTESFDGRSNLLLVAWEWVF